MKITGDQSLMSRNNIPVIVLSSGDPERVSSVYKETRKFNIFPKMISCSSKEVYESERDFANTVTMAHRKAWEYIVEKSIKRAIILEDDVRLIHDPRSYTDIIDITRPDVCLLGYSKASINVAYNKIKMGKLRTIEGISVGKSLTTDLLFGSVAYYITNLGAQKLLQSDKSIVIDEWYRYEEQCDLDLYHIRPIVAMEKTDEIRTLRKY